MPGSLEALSRAQLQAKAKTLGIPANLKSTRIIEELRKATPERMQTQKIVREAARKTRRAARRARPPATPKLTVSVACPQREGDAKYQIGTSGFMVSRALWTSLPCLNCIEINSTFYHLPQASTVESWKTLPPQVGVVIKASKYITHQKRLHDAREAWEKLWALIQPLGSRLRCVLFQLPPSFHCNETNIDRVTAMREYLPSSLPVAFEFRDISWFVEPVYEKMRHANFCMVGTFIKKAEGAKWLGSMPKGLLMPPLTSNISYLRVHGGRGYRGSLTQAQLGEIRSALASNGAQRSFVMFNNTFFDRRGQYCEAAGKKVKYAAVCNAAQFSSELAPSQRRLRVSRKGGTTRQWLQRKDQGVHYDPKRKTLPRRAPSGTFRGTRKNSS